MLIEEQDNLHFLMMSETRTKTKQKLYDNLMRDPNISQLYELNTDHED